VVKENLSKDPIKVRQEQQAIEGDLGTMSRINYSKIYTVEHYVKVLNIGMVEVKSLPTLIRNSHVRRADPIEKPRRHPSRSQTSTSKKDDRKEDRGSKGHGHGQRSYKHRKS
jgi:hypothetical protein